jgi:beta-barrel assembly-enhancing protease
MGKCLGIAVVLCAAVSASAQLRNLKPGFNLFTADQDVQLGKEARAEVEKSKPILHDARLNQYLDRLGQRLAASPKTGKFPFTFEVVSDRSINAFALPGGPVFVHTATIAAAQNEAQLAGVLAHEMSHVALRHGTHEASKAQALQTVAGLVGSAAGTGMMGQLAKMGIGLGANSMLLHYSRDAEAQADYNGAQVMGDAGYDPREMAKFFQLLETKGSDGRIAQFLSDHPTPGNRVAAVEKEVSYMPAKTYQTDSPEFQRIRALVRTFPPPTPAPAPAPK